MNCAKNNILHLMKWILVAYVITIVAFMLFAFILTYTDFPDNYMSTAVMVSVLMSICVSGWMSSKNIKRNGWLNGSLMGFVYILTIYLVRCFVFHDSSIGLKTLGWTLLAMVVGALSGIIGINVRSASK